MRHWKAFLFGLLCSASVGQEVTMNRSEMVSVRVLPEEKRALVRIARQERRKPSELLREMIREAAKERDLWPPAVRR